MVIHSSARLGADSAKACYEHTICLIADAAKYLNSKLAGKPAIGGTIFTHSSLDRVALSADLMPRLWSLMTGMRRKVGHISDLAMIALPR